MNAFVDFRKVKSQVTMLQVLERYGLMAVLKQSGDRLSGCCPIHKGSNPTQFRVSVSRNCWNCFGSCGRGGNVIDLVQLLAGITFREAALLLQEWFMPGKGIDHQATAASATASMHPHTKAAPPSNTMTDEISDDETGENPPLSFELKSLKQDHPYPAERGLTAATVKSYGIGYCSKGCLRGYLAIPIRNREGKLVAYMGRWPGDPPADTPKYKLPKGFRKNVELFNLDRAAQADASQPLLVVEGVFDCLHLVQLGYPRTVALLGSALSARQQDLLRDAVGAGGGIFLLLDADDAGRKGSADAAGRLSRFGAVRTIDIGRFRSQPEQLSAEEAAALLAA